MPSEDQSQAPFDERAALEQLERLQQDLEASRQRRKDASAAFDAFVSSFRKEPGKSGDVTPPRTEPRSLSPRFDAPVLPLPKGRRKPHPLGILAGGAVAIAAGVILTRAWRGSPEPPNTPAAVQAPAAGEPAGSTAAGSPAGTFRGPGPLPTRSGSELIALRDVWVRATVDGERVVERELAAGARVPLRGRTIVIRAGDAGAVRIVVDGQDRGTLGADGVVATRTYTASAPR